MKTVVLTCLALTAFASNSVLCRLALDGDTIDAVSFTVIRLIAGIVTLCTIVIVQSGLKKPTLTGSWTASFMLFLYAITFSLAYISLNTGTGALILFGSVQISMIMISILTGSRLHATEWLGIAVAFAGIVYLVIPGVDAPSLAGFVLMTTAGIAWGVYTLKGRNSSNPLLDTSSNFIRTLPLVAILLIISIPGANVTGNGIVLAVLSGGLASGIGYSIWYAALKNLTATQAAVVQLSVPIIAALGGVTIVSEPLTVRLMLSSVVILGGITIVIMSRYRIPQTRS